MRLDKTALLPVALAASLFLLLGACARTTSTTPTVSGPAGQTVADTGLSSLDLYRLVPGDIVKVDVYREPDLSTEYSIEPDGRINFPLLGRIPASGSTTSTLEKIIARGLSQGYLVNPDVRVSIAKYRPIYVGGAVNRPGEYTYKPGLTAQQATTLAGGTTRFASEDKIYVQRYGKGPEKRYRITPDTPIYPGDIITIEERLF